jgi:hypothetical protein
MKTLKFALLLFAALVIGKAGRAQSSDVTFGIRAGANYSELYGDPATLNRKGKVGVVAGAFARIGDRLYVEPGAYFASYGSKFDFNAQRYDVKFTTLQVPVLIGYKFINTKDFDFHGAVGPEADFNLKKPNSIQELDYKSFTAAGRVNAGVDIQHLTIDMGYNYGFDKANKKLDQKVGMYSLTIGFKL